MCIASGRGISMELLGLYEESLFFSEEINVTSISFVPFFHCQNIQCVHRTHTQNKETHKTAQFEMFALIE